MVPHKIDSSTLTLHERRIVSATSDFVRSRLSLEPTGHDWWHAERVRRTASFIASEQGADMLVVELASLLHDVADFKFTGSLDAGPRAAREWLCSLEVEDAIIDRVCEIIARISFKGANVAEDSLSKEGACVRDADRLDAVGAIGIARTFAYGGFVGRPLHDPGQPPVMHETFADYAQSLGTTINHFYEKLLLLQDRLLTPTGKRLGAARHATMVRYLEEFGSEWQGADLLPTATDSCDRR